jgi:hypothetical protein
MLALSVVVGAQRYVHFLVLRGNGKDLILYSIIYGRSESIGISEELVASIFRAE